MTTYCMELSIIIPVYNSSKFLRECLDSILKQDSYEYEIICVDDGSEDNSLDILHEYEKLFYNYKIIKQEHRGLAAARNNGIKVSCGEYIYFVDSDDIVGDNFINNALMRAKNEKLDVLMFSFENFATDNVTYRKYEERILKIKRTEAPDIILSGIKMMKYLFERNEYYPMVWIQIAKRSLLLDKQIMFYEGFVFEDMLYTFRLLWHSKRVRSITDVGYKKRIHEESICGRPENIHNVESLWHNYKKLIVLCEQFNQDDDNYEYVAKTMINRSINQLMLHFVRLSDADRSMFINGLSRWDKIKFELLSK